MLIRRRKSHTWELEKVHSLAKTPSKLCNCIIVRWSYDRQMICKFKCETNPLWKKLIWPGYIVFLLICEKLCKWYGKDDTDSLHINNFQIPTFDFNCPTAWKIAGQFEKHLVSSPNSHRSDRFFTLSQNLQISAESFVTILFWSRKW